jgi:uncharacterized protein (TIGR03086 family)
MTDLDPPVDRLARGLDDTGTLLAAIGADQWSAPTPCTEWTVRDVVTHLVVLNLTFVALLGAGERPVRGADHLGDDPVDAYRRSSEALVAAFRAPGVLERTYPGPLGDATGADRLDIRLADLLAHAWDLARATGLPVAVPDDLAEHALAFIRTSIGNHPREGRFGPEQPAPADAPALDRLAAFLGRPLS